LEATFHFFTRLSSGDYSPLDRVRRIANNIGRRTSGEGCCGNYGEPGC